MKSLDTIYLIHHSHTDIGYTHDQPVVWEMERRFIDAAIDACEQHLDHDGDHAFRWVVETIVPLLYWIEHSSDRQVERFLKLERSRRIEVMGMFAHITPLADTAELVEMCQPIYRLRREYGLTIRHAMDCDVNGQNWGLVDVLLDAGIEGFSMAINQHAGGAPFQRPNVFQWEGPSGRCIPAFNGWVYAMGDDMRIGRDMEQWRTHWLPWLLDKLEQVHWPLPFLPVQTYHPFGDNGSANYHLSRFIQDWNAWGEKPRIRLSTYADWWDALRPYADQLPVYRGDWTDYWNFGSISSAREAGINRASRARLVGADKLYGVLSPLGVGPGEATDPQNMPSEHEPGRDPAVLLAAAPSYRETAWKSLYLWDEHTWGADVAVSQPENEDTAAQWYHKAQYAYQARSLSLMLQRDGVAELSLLIPRDEDDTLIVFNPLPWKRTVSGPVSASLVEPRGFGDDPSASRHHQDRMKEGRQWWLKGVETPAFGYTVVGRGQLVPLESSARDIFSRELGEAGYAHRESAVIESEYHRITFDRECGGLISWRDKRLNREIIDQQARWRFGGVVYERLADLQHPSPRRLMYDTVTTVRDKRGWRTDWRAERWGATRLLSHKVVALPGGKQIVQVVEVDGLASPATYRVFLPDDNPALEIQTEWLMGLNARPEATYIAMPFAVPDATARLDLGGQAMRPEADQIPGCCRDYFTVQNWVDFSSAEWGVTVACPDNPMVQLGDFHFGHDQSRFELERALLLGWVTNNYWETNFRAYQPGKVSARYLILPHAGGFDEAQAHHFGMEAAVPVTLQSAFEPARAGAALPRSASFLALPEPPIVVLHVLPAWAQHDSERSAVFVRLLNASDETQAAVIGSGLLAVRGVQQCDLFGTPVSSLDVADGTVRLEIPARRVAVLRLTVDRR
jgi:alpha-mannosidase